MGVDGEMTVALKEAKLSSSCCATSQHCKAPQLSRHGNRHSLTSYIFSSIKAMQETTGELAETAMVDEGSEPSGP